MSYTVITDNGGGESQIYHDIAGEIYTFPTRYRKILTPGTKVVYHRAKKKSNEEDIPGRLSEESHYFGTAEIGAVTPTNDGNLRATICNYHLFQYPVMIHRPNGEYYEIKPFFQQGVRATNKEVYDAIVAASTIKIAPVPPRSSAQRGTRTLISLQEILKSNIFCKGRYQVVTGNGGYFLKNNVDGVYYELGKSKAIKSGELKVLAKKTREGETNLSFLIRHDSTDLGFLDPIDNGLRFSGKIDGQAICVNLLM